MTGVTEAPVVPALPSGSESWGPLGLLGAEVAPGDKRRLFLGSSESFAGTSIDTSVLVARGAEPGPMLCLTAGVHGDELNGIEVVRSLFEHLTPSRLAGTLVGLPVVNLHGFRRSSRYLPDRRDLNRFFPGHPKGSSASRIAFAVFDTVVRRCDALVDLHTGSFHRTNMPQIRANLAEPRLLQLARAFGVGIVVHTQGQAGTLRRAATDAGVAAITYEAGEPMRFQRAEIDRGVRGVRNLMAELGMVTSRRGDSRAPLVFYRSSWVRVDDGGIFINERQLGDRVRAGDVMGSVTDPISNERIEVHAPVTGRIIGMALSQVVIPGFAAFHVGIDGARSGAGALGEEGADHGAPHRLDSEEAPE